jgi:hypothetical protein
MGASLVLAGALAAGVVDKFPAGGAPAGNPAAGIAAAGEIQPPLVPLSPCNRCAWDYQIVEFAPGELARQVIPPGTSGVFHQITTVAFGSYDVLLGEGTAPANPQTALGRILSRAHFLGGTYAVNQVDIRFTNGLWVSNPVGSSGGARLVVFYRLD